MAIKGKSKSRGSRTVARGPKPAYVPVKVPWWRRRGLWIAIGTVLAIVAIEALVYGFAKERTDSREQEQLEQMSAAVNDYRAEVEPILATVGNAVPPSSFDAFPALATAIGALEGEEVPEEALESVGTTAEDVSTTAGDAADLFEEIDVAALVTDQGFSREFVLYLLNSKDGFTRSMRLYREAALLLTLAVEAEEGPIRDGLVTRARGIHDLAEATFATAYADYVEAQIAAGVFAPTNAGVPITGATG
jgi:hypothetical protein